MCLWKDLTEFMKRPREYDSDRGDADRIESPFLAQFEIIYGLTKKTAAEHVEAQDLGFRRFCHFSTQEKLGGDGFDVNLSALLAHLEGSVSVPGAYANGSRKLLDSITAAMHSASYVSFIRTVELVAHDGHTLIMVSPPPGPEDVTVEPGSERSQLFHRHAQRALQRLRFDKRLDEVFPGDTLLLQVTENAFSDSAQSAFAISEAIPGARASDVTQRDGSVDGSFDYGDHLVTYAEFITFHTEVFSSADAWRDAVRSNVAAVSAWLAVLSAQPPGLSQLSYLQACVLGHKNLESLGPSLGKVRIDGWVRSLQLPLLLKVFDDPVEGLDRKTLDLLRRSILSVLCFFVSMFKHAQAVMPLTSLYEDFFASFIASPLFLEGFTTVLAETSGGIGSLTWDALMGALKDAIVLCLRHLCHYTPAVFLKHDKADTLAAYTSWRSDAAPAAIGSFQTLLHRLSGVWLGKMPPAQQKRVKDRFGPGRHRNERLREGLEGLATQGVLEVVAQWLQYKELKDTKASSLLDTVDNNPFRSEGAHGLRSLLRPPALAQLEDLEFVLGHATEKDLNLMRATYTPYLTQNATHFVQAAARAAYGELYAPTLSATRTFLQSSAHHRHASEKNTLAMRITSVRFPQLRSRLSDYTWHDARHHALFGLPVLLDLDTDGSSSSTADAAKQSSETQNFQGDMQELWRVLQHTASIDAVSQGSEGGRGSPDGSCFAYVVVCLPSQPVLFPVIMINLHVERDNGDGVSAKAQVKAFVMRDVDMLAEFVQTSAAMEAPALPNVWLVTARQTPFEVGGGVTQSPEVSHRLIKPPKPRVLPVGTPALTYLDLIEHLVMLHEELLCGMSYNAASKDRAAKWAVHQSPQARTKNVVSGLWLWYFATGELPIQRDPFPCLMDTRLQRIVADESKQVVAQEILQEIVESGRFSLGQVEALHALCGGAAGGFSAAGVNSAGAVVDTRIATGCVGAGKTTVLYTCSAVRGRQMAVSRKGHQATFQPQIKESTAALKRSVARLRAAASALNPSIDDEDQSTPLGQPFSPADVESNAEESVLTDALEKLAAAVEAHGTGFDGLSRAMRYCGPSLLIRAADPHEEPPSSVVKLLHQGPDPDHDAGQVARQTTSAGPLDAYHRSKLTDVLAESHRRACHAPLAAILTDYLFRLRQLGDALTRLENEPHHRTREEAQLRNGDTHSHDVSTLPPPLHLALLPLVLGGRDMRELVAAAMKPARRSWVSYVRQELWGPAATTSNCPPSPAKDSGKAEDKENPGCHWTPLRPRRSKVFEPAQMPSTMHLPLLTPDQASGWWRVYAEKQVELIQHLRERIDAAVRQVFRVFCDLVYGVAAVSQVTKQHVILCSEKSILKHLHLPFLWIWAPSHLFIDDFHNLKDGMFLSLPAPNSLTLSLPEQLPVYTEHYHTQVAMVLLRSLRKQLEDSGALSTTVLNESLRSQKESIQTVLAKLCTYEVRLLPPGSAEEGNEAGHDATTGVGDLAPSESDPSTKQRAPCLPGLASCSPVEVWTHSTPLFMSAKADVVAATFVRRYLAQYDKNSRVHIFFPFTEAFAAAHRQLTEHGLENSNDEDGTPRAATSLVCVPWSGSTSEEIDTGCESDRYEAADECELGLVCLSSLAEKMAEDGSSPTAAVIARGDPHHPSGRHSLAWDTLLQTPDNLFHQKFSEWLWRVLSRVRNAVILIGRRELFARVSVLEGLERFVLHQRRVLAPPSSDHHYWLPSKVRGSVLALRCPAHSKCHRTATIVAATGGAGSSSSRDTTDRAPAIRLLGEERCQSICLHGYDGCENRSHVCLRACHLTESENEALGSAHAICPYPCRKRLSCGHLCFRPCGEPCTPCRFVGLRELPCGQRVVSGIDPGDRTIRYAFWPHFQEALCGAPARRCEIPVSVTCPRCGAKLRIPCFRWTAYQRRTAESGAAASTALQGSSSVGLDRVAFILSPLQCAGCVGVYNKVAARHGLPELAVPTPESWLAVRKTAKDVAQDASGIELSEAEQEDEPASQGSDATQPSLPWDVLPAQVQAELERAFELSKKKVELLLKKEALEISSGPHPAAGPKASDHALCQAEYDAHKAEQTRQEERWNLLVQAQVNDWAEQIRDRVEKQILLNARMESTLPLLLSEAAAEVERQMQTME